MLRERGFWKLCSRTIERVCGPSCSTTVVVVSIVLIKRGGLTSHLMSFLPLSEHSNRAA